MKRNVFRWMMAVVFAGAALCTAVLAHAADPSSPDRAIEGIWRLDVAQSDDPAKLPAMRRPTGSRRAGAFGTPDDKPSPADSVALLRGRPMWRLRHPAKQVVVFVLTETVEFTEDERPALEFAMQDSLDAHTREAERKMGVARWKGGQLVTHSAIGSGRYLIETYQVSADGATLTVRSRTEGGPEGAPALELRRVYRRYDGE